jgi:hypothetical protein
MKSKVNEPPWGRKVSGSVMGLKMRRAFVWIGLVVALGLFGPLVCSGTTWYVSSEKNALDSNPGTLKRPVKSVAKAVSLAKPGDTVMFAPDHS